MLKITNRRNQVRKYFWCILLVLAMFLPYNKCRQPALASTPFDGIPPCLFCEIASGHLINTKIVFETDECVIFKDIRPASMYHYLAVPKRHIDSLETMTIDDIPLVYHLAGALKQFYKSKGIETDDALFGFHMKPFISVRHLHMHGIAPRSTMNWMNRFIFAPGSSWFRVVEDARKYLENKS